MKQKYCKCIFNIFSERTCRLKIFSLILKCILDFSHHFSLLTAKILSSHLKWHLPQMQYNNNLNCITSTFHDYNNLLCFLIAILIRNLKTWRLTFSKTDKRFYKTTFSTALKIFLAFFTPSINLLRHCQKHPVFCLHNRIFLFYFTGFSRLQSWPWSLLLVTTVGDTNCESTPHQLSSSTECKSV